MFVKCSHRKSRIVIAKMRCTFWVGRIAQVGIDVPADAGRESCWGAVYSSTVTAGNTAGYTLPQLQSALLAQIWIRNPPLYFFIIFTGDRNEADFVILIQLTARTRVVSSISQYLYPIVPHHSHAAPDRLILGSVGYKGYSLVLAFDSGSAGPS